MEPSPTHLGQADRLPDDEGSFNTLSLPPHPLKAPPKEAYM